MKSWAIALIFSVVLTTPALGGPGDPRLIQGKLEWPATVSGSEPFIVLRGDDGRMYYADVVAAQRYVQGTLTAGTPTALLGLESIKPHEIIAVALGTGDAAALSLSLAQATPTASVTAPSPPAATPSGASAPAAPSAASAPSAPSAASAPSPAPAASTPSPAATTSAPSAPSATSAPSAAAPPAVLPPPRLEEGRTAAPGDEGRWTTVRGTVYGVAGQNLFIRRDDGRVVMVDIAKLEPATAQRLRPGSPVAVVAVPVGNKYQATGLVEAEPAKPTR